MDSQVGKSLRFLLGPCLLAGPWSCEAWGVTRAWKGWQVCVHLRWAQGEGNKASGLVCEVGLRWGKRARAEARRRWAWHEVWAAHVGVGPCAKCRLGCALGLEALAGLQCSWGRRRAGAVAGMRDGPPRKTPGVFCISLRMVPLRKLASVRTLLKGLRACSAHPIGCLGRRPTSPKGRCL
ncbi:unnamed protein product [Prunus armeniaca]